MYGKVLCTRVGSSTDNKIAYKHVTFPFKTFIDFYKSPLVDIDSWVLILIVNVYAGEHNTLCICSLR